MTNARSILAASVAMLCLAFAAAQAQAQEEKLALRSSQTPDTPKGDIRIESNKDDDAARGGAWEPDWSVLNWDLLSLPAPAARPQKPARKSAAPAANPVNWNRTDKEDGSSAVTVKRALPTTILDSKIGIDMTVAARAGNNVHPIDPDKLLPGYVPGQSSGAAWANLTTAGPDLPLGWDKTSFDARFDPAAGESKLGTRLSKSVPLGERFSVTLQNSYAMTHVLEAPATPDPMTGLIPQTGPSDIYTADTTARLSVLPTGTAFSVGTTMSTSDDRWLTSVRAEQKLFGGLSITGAISETADSGPNKSLTAGFKRNW